MTGKTVSNATPRAILKACQEFGFGPRELIEKARIDENSIVNSEGRVPFEKVISLWDLSYRRTQDRMIGLRAAKQLPLGAFKILDYIVISSENLEQALLKAFEYYPLINKGFTLDLTERGNNYHVELHNPDDPGLVPFQYVDFVLGCVLTRVRYASGFEFSPKEVHLSCNEPKDSLRYSRFFRSPVSFNRTINQIIFDRESLRSSLTNSDPVLCEMLDNYAGRLVNRLSVESDLLTELSKIIRKNLRSGEGNLSSSARELGMSSRSLQRKLQTRGISYRELLTRIRFELAERLIAANNHSLEEIAFMTGYSEKSSFCRAYKNWNDKPKSSLEH